MGNYITRTFAITRELRDCLEAWAAADDRSASYVLRDILTKECARREAGQREIQARQAQEPSIPPK